MNYFIFIAKTSTEGVTVLVLGKSFSRQRRRNSENRTTSSKPELDLSRFLTEALIALL